MSEQLWYAGLPVVRTRSLAAEELEELDRRIKRGRWWSGMFTVIAMPFFFLAANVKGQMTPMLVLLAVRAVFGVVPLFASDAFTNALRRDRKAGIAYVCESAGDDELPASAIDVLPESRLIWTRDGARPEKLTFARRTTTAALPAHAVAAANFVRPVDGNEQVLLHQRPLSADELRELEAYAPAVTVPRIVLVLVAATGAVATFALALQGRLTTLAAPIAFAALALGAGVPAYRAWKLRRRVEGDLRNAYVLIVRIRDGETLSVPHEFLPSSQILWTSAGEPANWRK